MTDLIKTAVGVVAPQYSGIANTAIDAASGLLGGGNGGSIIDSAKGMLGIGGNDSGSDVTGGDTTGADTPAGDTTGADDSCLLYTSPSPRD